MTRARELLFSTFAVPGAHFPRLIITHLRRLSLTQIKPTRKNHRADPPPRRLTLAERRRIERANRARIQT